MAKEKDAPAQGPLEIAMQRIQEAGRRGSDELNLSSLGLGPVLPSNWPGWEALGRLKKLFVLHLQLNRLAAIPRQGWKALGLLDNLARLHISANDISEIPLEGWEALEGLKNLWTLDLQFNRLSSIPDEAWGVLGRLRNLSSLWLGSNKIAVIPGEGWEELGRLERLMELDLSHNRISDIPFEAAGALPSDAGVFGYLRRCISARIEAADPVSRRTGKPNLHLGAVPLAGHTYCQSRIYPSKNWKVAVARGQDSPRPQ